MIRKTSVCMFNGQDFPFETRFLWIDLARVLVDVHSKEWRNFTRYFH